MKSPTKMFFIIFVGLLFLQSCDPKNGGGSEPTPFNRGAMLENWADNIIVPGYADFLMRTEKLMTANALFVENPNENTLASLRDEWASNLRRWQRVSMFEIGKAEELNLRNNINVFPVDTSKILLNITSANYNLALPSNIDAQGYQTLDFLLFGIGENDAEILGKYTSDPDAEKYKIYLDDVVHRINALITQVSDAWQGDYRDQFVANNGSSVNASVDQLVNDLLFYYEKNLRAGKIGIPAGVFSSSVLPSHVEAFYREDYSRFLLLESLDAFRDFFTGVHFGALGEGVSLKAYLDHIRSINNGDDIATMIIAQFDASMQAINVLDENFKSQINNDNSKMLEAYDALQKNVVLLKIDMLQALNINVDFIDADGD